MRFCTTASRFIPSSALTKFASSAALYSEIFPAHVRYSGASLGYQLGGAIAGFVPLTAASLVGAAGGAYWPIPALIAAMGAIGCVCLLLVRPAGNDDK